MSKESWFLVGMMIGVAFLAVVFRVLGETPDQHHSEICEHYLTEHVESAADTLAILRTIPECDGYDVTEDL